MESPVCFAQGHWGARLCVVLQQAWTGSGQAGALDRGRVAKDLMSVVSEGGLICWLKLKALPTDFRLS